MPRLIILGKNLSVRQINIDGTSTTIGRAPTNRVCFDSDKVSRHHAIIQWEGSRFVLTDMGSRNGTFLNERRISNHSLENGDAISIGDFQVRFLYSNRLLLPGEALKLMTMPASLPQMDAVSSSARRYASSPFGVKKKDDRPLLF